MSLLKKKTGKPPFESMNSVFFPNNVLKIRNFLKLCIFKEETKISQKDEDKKSLKNKSNDQGNDQLPYMKLILDSLNEKEQVLH